MKRFDKAVRVAAILSLAVVALLVAGFFYFLAQIPDRTEVAEARADGIVVLTGAASRITDAVRLLDDGRAKRLLITGVHPTTSREALNRQMPEFARLFACCIDIGHSAQNTAGNAAEARAWAGAFGFRSLIVVTSNYHLPRSLAEFARAMPEARLTPYAVVSESFREKPWLADGAVLRVVLIEYAKYLASIARRTFVDPHSGAAAPAVWPDREVRAKGRPR